MRAAILMMLLAGASSTSAAAWVELGSDEPETFTIHTDPATVRRADNIVRMWALFDYKAAQVVGKQTYRSEKAQQEYDCQEERVRVLYFSDHSGNMAGGAIVLRTSMAGDWAPVGPRTVNEVLWKVACWKQ